MENKVLVIEDNVEMLANIADILKLANYTVITAKDGKEGVLAANKFNPDIIVCDVMMPQLDGFGVLHLLGSTSKTSSIPFIFLTARSDKVDFRKAMNLGAADFITKPFDGLELLNAVELRLKKSHQHQTDFEQVGSPTEKSLSDFKKVKEFQELLSRKNLRNYRKRSFIYIAGQMPANLYYVESGKVKTYRTNKDGKELILNIYHPGEFFGYTPVIEDAECFESAVTMEEAAIYVVPKQDFLNVLYNNRHIAKKFIWLLASEVQQAEKRLLEMAYHSVRQKVATALLELYDGFNVQNQEHPIILATRRDIANLIGTALESLNRTLIDFKEEGLIDLKGDGILIVDLAGLKNLIA